MHRLLLLGLLVVAGGLRQFEPLPYWVRLQIRVAAVVPGVKVTLENVRTGVASYRDH